MSPSLSLSVRGCQAALAESFQSRSVVTVASAVAADHVDGRRRCRPSAGQPGSGKPPATAAAARRTVTRTPADGTRQFAGQWPRSGSGPSRCGTQAATAGMIIRVESSSHGDTVAAAACGQWLRLRVRVPGGGSPAASAPADSEAVLSAAVRRVSHDQVLIIGPVGVVADS